MGLLCSTLLLVSCGGGVDGSFTGSGMAVSPTAVVAVTPTFFAEPVILISSCLDGSALVPAVTLVVTSSSSSALDTVTLHLIDGANVGGPTVTFPNATLTGLFGT